MVFPITGGTQDTGAYDVSNSLRFNDADTPSLTLDLSGGAGNRKTWTASFWFKLGNQDASGSSNQRFLSANTSHSDTNYGQIGISNNDTFEFGTGTQVFRRTNRVLRDSSAWYHAVVAFDSTQSTASNRVKIYINGVQETSFAISNDPSQDTDYGIMGAVSHAIGKTEVSGQADNETYDGYLAEFNFVDGTQVAQTAFGEFNDNGVWIPKKYTGNYGTNGWFLEFKQTGTSANSSGIGADTSGNDNHFTPNNLAAIDITTDTCTNNFATINPLANYFDPATLSEGNTRVDFANNVSTSYVISTIGVDTGKWYCEVNGVDIPNYGEIGIASRPRQNSGNNDKLTVNVNNYGYTANSGNVKNNSTAGSSYGDSFGDGDVIGIAMDLDNNKLYFSKNGTFQNSGDPTSGSTGTGAFSIAAASDTHDGVYYFAGGSNINNNDTRMDFNFGNPAYSISSGNSDANGHGNFEYSVPSGYFALCTKNLAEFG